MEEKRTAENTISAENIISEEKLERVTGGVADESMDDVSDKKDKNLWDLFENGN